MLRVPKSVARWLTQLGIVNKDDITDISPDTTRFSKTLTDDIITGRFLHSLFFNLASKKDRKDLSGILVSISIPDAPTPSDNYQTFQKFAQIFTSFSIEIPHQIYSKAANGDLKSLAYVLCFVHCTLEPPEELETILSMGFARNSAIRVYVIENYQLNQALELLMNGVDEGIEPSTFEDRVGLDPSVAQPFRPTMDFSDGPDPSITQEDHFTPTQPSLDQLLSGLGVSVRPSVTSQPPSASPPTQPLDLSSEPTSPISSPHPTSEPSQEVKSQFIEFVSGEAGIDALQNIQRGPSAMTGWLFQISQQRPEIVPMLLEHPQLFSEILFEKYTDDEHEKRRQAARHSHKKIEPGVIQQIVDVTGRTKEEAENAYIQSDYVLDSAIMMLIDS